MKNLQLARRVRLMQRAMNEHADELEIRDARHVYGPAILLIDLLCETIDKLEESAGIEEAKLNLLEAMYNKEVAKRVRSEPNKMPLAQMELSEWPPREYETVGDLVKATVERNESDDKGMM